MELDAQLFSHDFLLTQEDVPNDITCSTDFIFLNPTFKLNIPGVKRGIKLTGWKVKWLYSESKMIVEDASGNFVFEYQLIVRAYPPQ